MQPDTSNGARVARGALLLALAVPMACATMPPRAPFDATVVIPAARERVIVDQAFLVADSSGSMRSHRKFSDEKMLIQSFVTGMPEGSYDSGAVAFGGVERGALSLQGFDRSRMGSWASGLSLYGEATPLSEVLAGVETALSGRGGQAAVMVFSDGRPNLYGELPDEAASLAAARRLAGAHGGTVCIYTVQLGDDPRGSSFLHALAEVTGCGAYRLAGQIDDPASLLEFQRMIFLGAAPVAPEQDSDGDGVLDSADRCPGTPRGAQVDARGCWVIRGLNFDTDKADIKPEFHARLDEVVEVLKQNPEVRVRVEGHTDDRGSAAYNQALSERRANAVVAYLVSRGIASDRLVPKGFGEAAPVRPNDTPENRYMNRRTELSVID